MLKNQYDVITLPCIDRFGWDLSHRCNLPRQWRWIAQNRKVDFQYGERISDKIHITHWSKKKISAILNFNPILRLAANAVTASHGRMPRCSVLAEHIVHHAGSRVLRNLWISSKSATLKNRYVRLDVMIVDMSMQITCTRRWKCKYQAAL